MVKRELVNYLKDTAVLPIVFLPIVMSKIISEAMKIPGQEIFLLSVWILFAQVMVGIMLTGPNIIEERGSRTIDALLCTPLSFEQIIISKGFAILILSLFSQIFVYIINRGIDVKLVIMLLPMVVGSILFISIGAIIGLKVKSSQDGTAVSTVAMVFLFLIVSIYQTFPTWTNRFMPFIPSISVTDIMDDIISAKQIGIVQCLIVIGWVMICFIYIKHIAKKWTK